MKNLQNNVKPLLESMRNHWNKEFQAEITEPELMGILLSTYFEWSGRDIMKACETGLEDANFHEEAGIINRLIK